jgi:hypothetical protein
MHELKTKEAPCAAKHVVEIPTPGNSYRYQNERVTKFDCWKLLKRKGMQKRVKFEALRK